MNKKRLTIGATLMLIMLAVVATFNITFFASSEYYNKRLGDFQAMESQYKKLKEVSNVVEKYFVGEYEEAALMDGAMSGYIEALGDPWSAYYTAEQMEVIQQEDENTYVGIGIVISYAEESKYAITSITDGSPAEKAGVKLFDVLREVDGTAVEDFDTNTEMANAVRGEAGTTVKIGVQRGDQFLEFEMERAEVFNSGITTKMLDGNIGFIRISGFDKNVDVEFEKKLDELIEQGATSLIFDVRFNPGGYLEVLVHMLDKLLPEGTVISMTDKKGQTTEYKSDADCVELPMVVLTNQYSISAAEFFAASLQEYGVAKVVGDHTGGKGFAQSLVPLSDGSGVNISIQRYYTPKGVSLAGEGIAPDYEVSLTEEDFKNFYTLTVEQDAQLQKAIEILSPGTTAPAE